MGRRTFEKGDKMMARNRDGEFARKSGDIMGQPGRPQQGRAMPKEMPKERLTEDLLARLLASESPESYLAQGETIDRELPDYLHDLLISRDMKRAELARRARINATFVYDMFTGKCKPGRDKAIMLSLGMGCSLRETQRLLRLAGVAELWPKQRRDAIIIWCIERGLTCEQCDDELWRLKEKTLFRSTGVLS